MNREAKIERLRAALTEAGLPIPDDWDTALALVDEMAAVQAMVGGSSNAVALERALDIDDAAIARMGFMLAALDARRRAIIALERQGFRPRLSPRDHILIAQATQAGAELPLAVRRMRER